MQLMKRQDKLMHVGGLLLCALLGLGTMLEASAATNAGRVTQVHGRATVASPEGDIRRIRKGTGIASGATINTGSGSFAKIKFKDGGSIFLRPSTRFRVDAFEDTEGKKEKEEKSFFSLLKGGMRFVTGLIAKRNRNAYRINTPTATIGIRGTDAALQICEGNCAAPDGVHLLVFDGEVVMQTLEGLEVNTPAGKAAFVSSISGEAAEAESGDSPISEDNFPSPGNEDFAADCAP